MHIVGSDIDPDHFFNDTNNSCEYYTDEQFNSVKTKGAFSIIHFNSRSLYKNFNSIKEYMLKFSKFNIIAVSETWLNEEKGYNVELEGYELYTMNRKNKKGGGVAIYVDSALTSKIIKNMTTTIDGIMECLTIEISDADTKNIVITCLYRTPGSSIDTFNHNLGCLFENLNSKVHIVCGSLNIDLLNPHGNIKTTDFVNTTYSNSLFPVINKPSRITLEIATLMDHIFTNVIDNQVTAGLLINDISDPLPIFGIFQQLLKMENKTNKQYHKLIRYRTPRSLAAFSPHPRSEHTDLG